jgi:hypothetical protein
MSTSPPNEQGPVQGEHRATSPYQGDQLDQDLDLALQRIAPVVPAAYAWPTNAHLIADVAKLDYLNGAPVVDATYGRGGWWTIRRPALLICHDLHTVDGVDFRALPEADASVAVVALDPPYRLNGTPDRGDFDDRYGTDKSMRWQDKHRMILDGITEAARVLWSGGHLLLKCQDQVSSGHVRWHTREFPAHAETVGLKQVDRFDMIRKPRPQPSGRKQVHAHGRPSTLLVFRKAKR